MNMSKRVTNRANGRRKTHRGRPDQSNQRRMSVKINAIIKNAENPPFKLTTKPPKGSIGPMLVKAIEDCYTDLKSDGLEANLQLVPVRFAACFTLTRSEKEFCVAQYPAYLAHLAKVEEDRKQRAETLAKAEAEDRAKREAEQVERLLEGQPA